MATKYRKYKAFAPLFSVRDWMMEKTGLFELKKRVKLHFFYKQLIREDAAKKRRIENELFSYKEKVISGNLSEEDIVISLTSYGNRVYDALPYALYSLLKQTIVPKKIVVYLDKDKWSDDKLPPILKKYKSLGIDIRYIEDIGPHSKLVPALMDFPNNPIITIDDDLYYNKSFFTSIKDAYDNSDHKTVLGQWGCIPEKIDGKYKPYLEWKDCKYGIRESPISFYGCCGVCYPPHIFDEEIFKKEIFMELCPTADDIWFWAMEERQGINKAYIEPWGHGHHTSVNRIEEYDLKQTGTLMYKNVAEGKNNDQFKSVVEYYHLD